MILLNWPLALGALAFTVPLAIHLLFRNRFQIVDWGAMQFLESVVRMNRRRLQLRNWLLLLIRCAIPVLLAFCLARPVVTGWQQLRGDQPVAMVIILDTSYSMAAGREGGQQRLDAAIDAARRVIAEHGRGSEVTILTSDGVVRSGDPQSIRQQLGEVALGGPALDIDRLVSQAVRVAAESRLANRQIVLISDNAASDLTQTVLDAFPGIGERMRAVSPQPDFAWIDVLAEFSPPAVNRRISRAEPSLSVAVPGQSIPWLIEARVEGGDHTQVDLQVRVNGEVVERQAVAVRNGVATAIIPIQLDRVGRHAIEVAVLPSGDGTTLPQRDAFPVDDVLYREFRVVEPIGVWLVDGNPATGALQSDTDFLALALSPFALSRQQTPAAQTVDLFRTQKRRAGRLAEPTADFTPQVVVLADVARPSAADCDWLAEFVETRGGTLVVFAGKSIDPQWYDTNLTDRDNQPLLPLRFGDVRISPTPLGIDDTRFTYPPLNALAGNEKGTLSNVQVVGWREMIPYEQPPDDAQAVMRLEGGQPLIAVNRVGRGRVLQVATTADPKWTTLPLRPVFVPLMQRLLAYLTLGDEAQSVRTAGEPIVLRNVARDSQWTVSTPDGQIFALTAEPAVATDTDEEQPSEDQSLEGRLMWPSARLAGSYRFSSSDGQVSWATVNVPAADLNLAAVERAVRYEAARQMGATLYESVDAFLADDANRRFGRGIWQYVLMALLAALVIEPMIQQSRLRSA